MNDYFPNEVDPSGRVYVHTRCGGLTGVDGIHFVHICDPFWYCRSTYCCQCADYVPLDEVCWTDTGEKILDYRNRLRAETPLLLQAWRYGVGLLLGGALGAVGGGLIAMIFGQVQPHQIGLFVVWGGLAGAGVCYVLGTFILNRVFGMDYRRMR